MSALTGKVLLKAQRMMIFNQQRSDLELQDSRCEIISRLIPIC